MRKSLFAITMFTTLAAAAPANAATTYSCTVETPSGEAALEHVVGNPYDYITIQNAAGRYFINLGDNDGGRLNVYVDKNLQSIFSGLIDVVEGRLATLILQDIGVTIQCRFKPDAKANARVDTDAGIAKNAPANDQDSPIQQKGLASAQAAK